MASSIDQIEAAVQSIYTFVRRTAETTESGLCWETIDYENQPHRDPSVFNGVGGIPFFLVDHFRRYRNHAALDLAQGAIDWCTAYQGQHHRRGLHMGKTGVALAALHKAAVPGHAEVPASTLENARIIMAEPPGPVTDLLGGAASNGLFLLKLWQRTRDPVHLNGARRCAMWLEGVMQRDEHGTHCRVDPDGSFGFPEHAFLGVAHGIAGVAHFLACLAEGGNEDRWASLSRELFTTIERNALPIHGGLNWPIRLGRTDLIRCQWSHGAAGIGLTFLTAHRVLHHAHYLDLATQAAEATYAYGDFRNNTTQCTGLSGCGELLLEMYRTTGDTRWRERAIEFALLCLHYRESTPEGDAWPTDAPGLYSADYDYGASGVGHFLLRVLSDGAIPMPLM